MSLIAFADEEYPLKVGGTQVTSVNASDIVGNNTASYNATTKTLTLNGFAYTGYLYGISNEGIDGLTVIVNKDTNTIGGMGIISSGSLNIKGSGTLNIESTGETAIYSVKDLTISESVNITAEATDDASGTGIFCGESTNSKLTLESTGEINAKGLIYGLSSNGKIEITNGNVTAEGDTSGIDEGLGGAPLVIGTNAKLIAIGGDNGAIYYNTASRHRKVQNAIAGVAWTNKQGTVGMQNITVSSEGQPISNIYKKVEFPVSHTHNFTYSATGATITATCTTDGCTLPPTTAGDSDHVAKLILVKPTMTTYGQSGEGISEAATLTGLYDFNTATGKNVAVTDIKYVGRSGTNYDESTTAPTDAGKYTAKITVENKTASVDYEIATTYPIWIGGTQVTSANASNIDGSNKASYNADTNTLTLNGYSYTGNEIGIEYRNGTEDLNIVLYGKNTISITSTNIGIDASNPNLRFSGTGSLSLNSSGLCIDNSGDRNITIEGVTLNVESTGGNGINCGGTVTIANSRVTSKGLVGIFGKDVEIYESTVECSGDPYGIYGTITLVQTLLL